MATIRASKVFRYGVPVLAGLLLLIRLVAMIAVPLMDTTEARYGEIARKMAELNDWVTLWFDYGVPYWGKPPLAFWLTAASFEVFGVSEFAARLPHLIVSLAIIGLTGWMAHRRDRESAWPAIAIISAAPVFYIAAGAVMTDIALTLGVTLAMAGFWIALEGPAMSDCGRREFYVRQLASLSFFGGLAAGLLAKGPVALLLIGIPVFFWAAFHSRWSDVWRGLHWIPGLFLTMLITLPWFIAAEHNTPGFLRYFLVGEHFQRFVAPGWLDDRYGNAHDSPIGAIWLFALGGLLPWSMLLPIAAWRWRKTEPILSRGSSEPMSGEKQWRSFLLLWALAPLFLFTPARNAGWIYVLPGVPAAAILAGQWLAAQARQGRNISRVLCAGMLLTVAILLGVAAVWNQPATLEQKSVKALLAAAYGRPLTQQSAAAAVPLIFVRRRPFSAQFYTYGKAVLVADVNEAWSRIGDGAAYVALYNGNVLLGAAAAAKRNIRLAGRYGKFDLLFIEAR